MTSAAIHHALLRPAILQVLRASGFVSAQPAALETITDMAARYLLLLATSTAQHAATIHGHSSRVPTYQDVRLALIENGALTPQMTPAEELQRGEVEIAGELVPFEDLRGVQDFIDWAQGPVNKEIRRVAGFSGDELNVDQIAAGTDEKVDYLTGEFFAWSFGLLFSPNPLLLFVCWKWLKVMYGSIEKFGLLTKLTRKISAEKARQSR
jgi:transcription initiation factor TFIID subunit 3